MLKLIRLISRLRPFRYLISGGLVTLFNLIVQYLLVDRGGVEPKISFWISFHISVPVGALLHYHLSFSSEGSVAKKMGLYYLQSLFQQVINFLLFALFLNFFGLHHLLSLIISTIILQFFGYFLAKAIFSKEQHT